MKKTENQTFPANEFYPGTTLSGAELGIIDDIINAAGSLTSLLIHVFKRPPADTWSIWDFAEKTKYVTESLQVATTSVITGRSISVTNVFRELIAKVELNENWEKWKKNNSSFLMALFEANDEVQQYRTSGYTRYMQFINPQMINRVLHPAAAPTTTTATASIIGNKSVVLVLAIGVAALIIKVLTEK